MKKLISWLNDHPVIRKPLHTFWEAFIAVFLVGAVTVFDAFMSGGIDSGRLALISLLSASVAAALSALKTYVVESFKENKETK